MILKILQEYIAYEFSIPIISSFESFYVLNLANHSDDSV